MTSLPPRPSGDVLLERMAAAARAAAAAILDIYYQADHGVVTKDDNSPLTRADLAAHRAIAAALAEVAGGLPLLSEESAPPSWAQRRQWRRYWLVDPLDGTRDFIDRNGQFTVNIALVEDGVAVLGAVLAPVTDRLYLGLRDSMDPEQWRAWRVDGGESTAIHSRTLSDRTPSAGGDEPLVLLASRRHGLDITTHVTERLTRRFGAVTRQDLGSSLKMCLIAEGLADFYPRFGATGEWDTAAAQAVLEAAGGCLCTLDGRPRRYNQAEGLINPPFYAAGDPSVDWPALLAGLG